MCRPSRTRCWKVSNPAKHSSPACQTRIGRASNRHAGPQERHLHQEDYRPRARLTNPHRRASDRSNCGHRHARGSRLDGCPVQVWHVHDARSSQPRCASTPQLPQCSQQSAESWEPTKGSSDELESVSTPAIIGRIEFSLKASFWQTNFLPSSTHAACRPGQRELAELRQLQTCPQLSRKDCRRFWCGGARLKRAHGVFVPMRRALHDAN